MRREYWIDSSSGLGSNAFLREFDGQIWLTQVRTAFLSSHWVPVEDRSAPAAKGSAILDVKTCLRRKVESHSLFSNRVDSIYIPTDFYMGNTR